MFTYSPSMNIANAMPEYSVWNPATSSDSASARSNGGRLTSASAQIRNTTNAGNWGIAYQTFVLRIDDLRRAQVPGEHQQRDERRAPSRPRS